MARLRGPFQTDGQAIILEDYLEIRPDRRRQLEELAQAGKLVIGPWYVLPDEFLVSGESLVRNIRLGREIARSFGAAPSQAGFVCDLFGHNSQMPQIFAGFGIEGALIWRGTQPRGNATCALAIARRHGGYRLPLPRHRLLRLHVQDSPRHRSRICQWRPSGWRKDMSAYLRDEAEHTEVDPILLFDGGDHEEWDPDVYAAMFSLCRRRRG